MQYTDPSYQKNKALADLAFYAKFYDSLAFSVLSYASSGARALVSLDTYIHSSMGATLRSVRAVAKAGQISDAFSLLRRFSDCAIVDIYANAYLLAEVSFSRPIVEKIDSWCRGSESLPDVRVMTNYIGNSHYTKAMDACLRTEDTYAKVRRRCNDYTHSNSFRYVMLNDGEICMEERLAALEQLRNDAADLIVFHLGHIFHLCPHFMASTDYLDSLEFGMKPEPNSQYWVAPVVQNFLNKVIRPRRSDVYELLKTSTSMELA